MKICHVEAELKGYDAAARALIDSIPEVVEKYRADGVPTWAGTFKLKRHLFNWLNKLGKVQFSICHVEHGVFIYKVEALMFKGWTFAMTPELCYMVCNIIDATQREGVADMTFFFRRRKFFIPVELHERFAASLHVMMHEHGERIHSIHTAIRPKPTLEEGAEGKEKRVLH